MSTRIAATRAAFLTSTVLLGASALSGAALSQTTVAAETVATFPDTRPGNVAVTPQGRIIVSNQPLDGPMLRVREIMPDGTLSAFPNEDWAAAPDGPDDDTGLTSVIGVSAARDGTVWMLDMGGPDAPAQLIGWNSVEDALAARIEIGTDVLQPNSFLQDFALDEARGLAIVADMTLGNLAGETRPAFVVIDLASGEARRVMESDRAFLPPDRDVVIDGSLLANSAEDGTVTPLRFGLNPIAIGPDGEWVYFGTINGDALHRIPTAALADASLTDTDLSEAVEPWGAKVLSDGIAVGPEGRVFVTDIEGGTVGMATEAGYMPLPLDAEINWPDGLAFGPDRALYITQNALHLHPAFNEGVEEGVPPYRLLRIAPNDLATAVAEAGG